MRLTKTDKEAFVRAVMQDVPQVDYREKIQPIVEAHFNALLPEKLRNPDDEMKEHMKGSYVYVGDMSFYVYGYHTDRFTLQDSVPELMELHLKNLAQAEERKTLEAKLKSVIEGCSTLKSALERLPEFAKYLPQERDGSGTVGVPAITDLVKDLTEAGFPKGEPWKEAA